MGAAVVAAELAEGPIDLRGVREGKGRVLVGEPVQPIDLQVDRRSLPRRSLSLARAGLLLPRLDRKLPIEELADRLRPIRRPIEDCLRCHAATVALRSDGGRLQRRSRIHAHDAADRLTALLKSPTAGSVGYTTGASPGDAGSASASETAQEQRIRRLRTRARTSRPRTSSPGIVVMDR